MFPSMGFFFSRIFLMIFVVGGAGLSFIGIRDLIQAKDSVNWPTTQGKVVYSSVEYHYSDDGSRIYHAKVMYDFNVNNTTFSGTRIAYGDYGSSNPSHARRVVNQYPKDEIATVYYILDNPGECLLEPGVKGQSFILPGFGLFFFTVGSVMVLRKQEVTEQSPEPDK